jgi:hypothetical protein
MMLESTEVSGRYEIKMDEAFHQGQCSDGKLVNTLPYTAT